MGKWFFGKICTPETYPIDNKFFIFPYKSLQIAIWLPTKIGILFPYKSLQIAIWLPTKIGILFLFAVKGTRVLQIVKISSHLLSILSYIDK